MTEPDPTASDAPGPRKRGEVHETHFAWPPSATSVWVFMVVVLMLGGPLTWWAVNR